MSRTKLDSKLAKAVEPHGALISFIYFDLDGGQVLERSEGSPYELSIVLVYSARDAAAAAETADKLADAIFESCEKRLSGSKDIILKTCFAISEDDLPVSRARVLMQWRLEYMTLKAGEGQAGPVSL